MEVKVIYDKHKLIYFTVAMQYLDKSFYTDVSIIMIIIITFMVHT